MSSDPRSGKVVIFSAPSGAGKTTITRYVLQEFPELEFSVSATTRAPRGTEKDGVDYYFLSPDAFRQRINEEKFVEWEEVYSGNFYGTLKSEVDRIWGAQRHVVFDVDVKGGINLKKYFGELALSIFIMPPSIDVLEKRLRRRGTETEAAIHTRVGKAFAELDFYREFDAIVINDVLDKTKVDVHTLVSGFLKK